MALSNLPDLKSHVFVETPFDNLMQKRIGKVLIICSNYDFYMLEEDGRIDEIIFNEYVGLNLRYPPVFVHANTAAKAHRLLKNGSVDLVVVWLTAGSRASFEISLEIRNGHPQVPIVALTHYSYELSMHLVDEDFSAIDLIFHWNGDSNIFLAIIKIVEDRMNLENDVVNIGVQAILLVEDSIRYYSTYLPIIYRLIFKQSRAFMHEALNEHKRMLRMRGRPKILLARTYEEAEALYDEHKLNLLGVISDISYPRGGEKDDAAGFRLAQKIKRDDKYFPVLLQSSNFNNETRAKELKVGFLYKNSPTLSIELRGFINQYFAFGDFEFKDSRTRETVTTAADLKGLQLRLQEVSDDTLKYHIIRNHFSKWLKARALFGLADLFYTVHAEDFESTTQVRQFLTEAIVRYRKYRSSGIIAQFDRARYDEYVTFSRIGEGALGGKGRGLAFIDSFIKKHKLSTRFEGINISIPRTVVLSTSVYDEFMEKHQLMAHLSELTDDQEVLRVVVKQSLPEWVFADLRAFLASVKKPIAVRSSSVLEDSHYQPFAGIFSTYMIPHDGTNPEQTLRVLCDAIRSVYASAFFNTSKAYVKATAHSMDEGKMAIILQEVTGSAYDGVFFPQISGVARSINFYPIGHEKASDGIAHLGFGLGRITVGGGQTLRVSPAHPKHILQLSSPASSLRETQKHFFGLDLNPESFSISTDDGVNLRKLKITEAPQDALQSVASTYDLQNNIIRPGTQIKGKRLITFENILKYDSLPLA
ncbi:MAG: hypothetical protein RIS47_318, partial [Bacteroidota bacterium]